MEKTLNVVIGDDNQTGFAEVEKDGLSAPTKSVDMKNQFVLDQIRKDDVRLKRVPSELMVANIIKTNCVTQKFLALHNLSGK